LQPGYSEFSGNHSDLDFHKKRRPSNVTSDYHHLKRTAAPHHVALETEMIQRLRGLQGKLSSLVKKLMNRTKVAAAETTNKPLIRMSLSKAKGKNTETISK
jgi:hypothetical protein